MNAISLPAAARRTASLARRHKVVTAVSALFVAAIIGVSLATTGSAAPNYPAARTFTLPALGSSGQPSAASPKVSLSAYQGKPVIVNFFASWCEPCQQETPLLASWYTQQHGKVALVGLDENDSAGSAQKFVAAKGVAYPVGFDPNTITASAYEVDALPQTFFLNAQHRVVYHWAGALTKAQLAHGLRLMTSAS